VLACAPCAWHTQSSTQSHTTSTLPLCAGGLESHSLVVVIRAIARALHAVLANAGVVQLWLRSCSTRYMHKTLVVLSTAWCHKPCHSSSCDLLPASYGWPPCRWNERYIEAKLSLEDRAAKLDAVAEDIEKDLVLLGCTAIEDKLQEGVPNTIKTLAEAGIRLWVLTGDKMVRGCCGPATLHAVSVWMCLK